MGQPAFGPGSTVVATLAIEVAPGQGAYHLTLTDGRAAGVSPGVPAAMTAGAAFEITVSGQ